MPTKKPVIQAVLDENYKEKFDRICKVEGRTLSNMTSYIIKQWIDNYESTITIESMSKNDVAKEAEAMKKILEAYMSVGKQQ